MRGYFKYLTALFVVITIFIGGDVYAQSSKISADISMDPSSGLVPSLSTYTLTGTITNPGEWYSGTNCWAMEYPGSGGKFCFGEYLGANISGSKTFTYPLSAGYVDGIIYRFYLCANDMKVCSPPVELKVVSSVPVPPPTPPPVVATPKLSSSISINSSQAPALSSYTLSGSISNSGGSYSGDNCWEIQYQGISKTNDCWAEAGSGAGSFSVTKLIGDFYPGVDNTYNFYLCANNGATCSSPVTLEVVQITPTVTWSDPSDISYGTELSGTQLNAKANVAGKFTYSPSSGTVLDGGEEHTLTTTFTPNSSNYSGASKSVSITVSDPTPELFSSISIKPSSGIGIPFGSYVLSGSISNSGGPYSGENCWEIQYQGISKTTDCWEKAGSGVGSFSVTKSIGEVQLNVDNTYNFYLCANNGATCSSPVTLKVVKITPTVTWSDFTIFAGQSIPQATASVPGTFSYLVANYNPGTRSITASFTPSDSTNYNTATRAVTMTVKSKINPVITWSDPSDISYGTELSGTQLNAKANVAGKFTYSPSSGTVLDGGEEHTLTTTFTPNDTTNYNITSSSVSLEVNKVASAITWSNPAGINSGTALSGTQLNATANVPGTFTYSPAIGKVLPTGTHTLTATFTPSSSSYSGDSKSVSIKVSDPSPILSSSISIKPSSGIGIAFGSYVLSGSVTNTGGPYAGQNCWEYKAQGMDRTNNCWTPAGSGAGSFSLTKSISGVNANTDNTYNFYLCANKGATCSSPVSIKIVKATPVITWADDLSEITYGTALSSTQLKATANIPGSFTYSPSSGTVLSGSQTHTLNATFVPSDTTSYNTVTSSVSIKVNPATPVVTWSNPSSIVSGAALSSSQLNATANVPGTFTYSPAVGTVLPVGKNTITANFIPSSTANYSKVSKTVSIEVSAPPITFSLNITASPTTAKDGEVVDISSSVEGTATGPITYSYVCESGFPAVSAENSFSCTYSNTGSSNINKIVTVTATRGDKTATKQITVSVQPRQSVSVPLDMAVQVTPAISGTASGTVTYSEHTCGGGSISAISGGSFVCLYSSTGTYTVSVKSVRAGTVRMGYAKVIVQ